MCRRRATIYWSDFPSPEIGGRGRYNKRVGLRISQYDIRLADFQYTHACQIINNINYRMWVGHFHISPESMVPCFRHTQLFRGIDFGSGADHLEDLIRVAMEECDFHYPALLMLAAEQTHDEDQFAFALMPTQGQS